MSALTAFDRPALPAPPADGASFALRLAGKYEGRVTGHFVQPGREGRYAPLPAGLPERLAAALRSRGVEQLYAHQAEAWDAVQRGGGQAHGGHAGGVNLGLLRLPVGGDELGEGQGRQDELPTGGGLRSPAVEQHGEAALDRGGGHRLVEPLRTLDAVASAAHDRTCLSTRRRTRRIGALK